MIRSSPGGNCIPLNWSGAIEELPDSGWDWAIGKAFEDNANGIAPNILCALQVMIAPESQGSGVSYKMIERMTKIGKAQNYSTLLAPVRPSKKSDYPLTEMSSYITWQNSAGLPFDPWLRVHQRLGARVVKICKESMRIPGTVGEWESWTKMRFPESGKYIVAGVLAPIEIDLRKDNGLYVESNVWVEHRID